MFNWIILEEEAFDTHFAGELSNAQIIVVFLCAIAPFALGYAYNVWKIRRWENKILPSDGAKSDQNFMNAYLCAAVLIMVLIY